MTRAEPITGSAEIVLPRAAHSPKHQQEERSVPHQVYKHSLVQGTEQLYWRDQRDKIMLGIAGKSVCSSPPTFSVPSMMPRACVALNEDRQNLDFDVVKYNFYFSFLTFALL